MNPSDHLKPSNPTAAPTVEAFRILTERSQSIPKLDEARAILVEVRGYLDRMGQEGVRERIDRFLAQTEKTTNP